MSERHQYTVTPNNDADEKRVLETPHKSFALAYAKHLKDEDGVTEVEIEYRGRLVYHVDCAVPG